jgi:glutamine---fructose-6-phosphate transaminase (isomerizing)
MCGIVGIIGKDQVARAMVDALKRLEYRGYDSAGVATITGETLTRRRAKGKLFNLEKDLDDSPLSGETGIGHTRWATHGPPTVGNAHPHTAGRVAVVHNGIIENHGEIRAELIAGGTVIESDTDTEVVAHLLEKHLENGLDPVAAMRAVVERVTGAFAFVVMVAGYPDMLLAARRASPLAIGHGDGEMFVGSDALALAPMTRRITYLKDGDWAVVRREGVEIFDATGAPVDRGVSLTEVSGALIGKGNYRHFMEKEIHEQPDVVGYTLFKYYDPTSDALTFPELPFDPATLPKLTIVAAGASYYAAMVAKYWFEGLARLSVEVDIASEFRYRNTVLPKDGAALFISQSGETLDTLMALHHARAEGQHILGLVNVPESTIEREADVVFRTLAGPEICVASTKAFTTQLMTLACLAVAWGKARGTLDQARAAEIMAALTHVPASMAEVLGDLDRWIACARELAQARDVIYLGRGSNYPIALEGALKLKELSYIHAEAYPAGEMKHGPIALLEEGLPVVMVAPHDEWFEKTASNLKEARARGAKVVLLSDKAGVAKLGAEASWAFELPDIDPVAAPLLYTLPVQLLGYYTAVEKGTDIDQPRNLAKSVTVE